MCPPSGGDTEVTDRTTVLPGVVDAYEVHSNAEGELGLLDIKEILRN